MEDAVALTAQGILSPQSGWTPVSIGLHCKRIVIRKKPLEGGRFTGPPSSLSNPLKS